MRPALSYLRTSFATNVGPDRDSVRRQRDMIQELAARAGYHVVGEHYAAVSGADPVDQRPHFTAMLAQIAGNGVRTIIVEMANRFARDLIVQVLTRAHEKGDVLAPASCARQRR
jgi:DNA invertase Pin-like site-specific DNA recombinase